eukprot:TRINITY_DN3379_c0_g1_i1.p1 TRINITY_DN3379_c0_g1~~TRINITY_DN3379_c0_g1_i1.p1  ORF type:complete len:504 (+),score=118.04 TRINITY_DN3379_c0_g1_i1:93-1514(+)
MRDGSGESRWSCWLRLREQGPLRSLRIRGAGLSSRPTMAAAPRPGAIGDAITDGALDSTSDDGMSDGEFGRRLALKLAEAAHQTVTSSGTGIVDIEAGAQGATAEINKHAAPAVASSDSDSDEEEEEEKKEDGTADASTVSEMAAREVTAVTSSSGSDSDDEGTEREEGVAGEAVVSVVPEGLHQPTPVSEAATAEIPAVSSSEDDDDDEESEEEENGVRQGELIDNVDRCEAVCQRLLRCDTLAVDIEGINLGRYGEVCIVQIADRRGRVFLFDVCVLGQKAFSMGLKKVLEAESVAKLFFDCRGDADALFHLHRVVLRNVLDMQVLCHCAVGGEQPFLFGFAKALARVLPYAQRQVMKGIKEAGQSLFAPDHGGTLQIWKRRPLHDALRKYCAQDVVHLFALQREWGKHLATPVLRAVSETRMQRRVSSARPETGPQLARRDFELPASTRRAAPATSLGGPAAKRPRPATS